MQEILFIMIPLFVVAFALCYALHLYYQRKEKEGANRVFKSPHLRHLVIMFAQEYPLSPSPLKDKSGQGLSPACQP